MNTFILTVQLMTRIPINKQIDVNDRMLTNGVALWPLVGLIIGAGQAVVYWLLAKVLPVPVAAAFAVLAELGINGGFHLDGLCDTADAIYSARTRERMLEIMKDSRVGTNGVIAAFFDLALKIIMITYLKQPVIILILAPVAGKMVQGLLMYKAVYPREKGLGHSYIGKISLAICLICTFLGMLMIDGGLALFSDYRLVVIPVICCIIAFGYRKYIEGKIAGMTGDTLGAGSEVIEILFYLFILISGKWI